METNVKQSRIITIENCESISLNGVEHIATFDEKGVVLQCDFGRIVIEGIDLKIDSLEKASGKILIKGKFKGLFFEEKKTSEGFLGRIFK
jgi:sporulation protein YabP